MKKNTKIILIVAIALSVLYSVLSGFGFGGTQTDTGGLVYQLIIVAALIFACSLVFTGIDHPVASRHPSTEGNKGNEAFIAGTLGLSLLFVFELYTFAYIYLYGGEHTDITINNYIRNCVYIFFIVAISYLTPPVFKAHRVIRGLISIITSCAVFFIFYAVLTYNQILIAYSALTIKAFCLIAATVLFRRIKRGHPVRLFSFSVRIMCFLEAVEQLLVMYGNIWNLRDIIISFYPLMYILIGYALVNIHNVGSNCVQTSVAEELGTSGGDTHE